LAKISPNPEDSREPASFFFELRASSGALTAEKCTAGRQLNSALLTDWQTGATPPPALSTVRWQKMFRMRVNKATIGQWSAKYIAGMRTARSLEWRCLWSCMGTMAWCAADFRATQPRQLGAARSDFGPGTARRPPDRHEMQHHRARALCDHRRPCWQRSGRPCMAPPEPLPLGPAAAANAPLPGMPQRTWPRALRCHHRSAQLHHRRAFRALGHKPLLPPPAAASSARSSSCPPAAKRICGPSCIS
jgi:hypothetical protein